MFPVQKDAISTRLAPLNNGALELHAYFKALFLHTFTDSIPEGILPWQAALAVSGVCKELCITQYQ